MGDGGDARIADQHLVDAACRRVALVGREDVGIEQRSHAGERARERARDLDRALAIGIRDELLPRCELQLAAHLLVQVAQRDVERVADVVVEALVTESRKPQAVRKERGAEPFDDADAAPCGTAAWAAGPDAAGSRAISRAGRAGRRRSRRCSSARRALRSRLPSCARRSRCNPEPGGVEHALEQDGAQVALAGVGQHDDDGLARVLRRAWRRAPPTATAAPQEMPDRMPSSRASRRA